MFSTIHNSLDVLSAALGCSPDELHHVTMHPRTFSKQLAIPRRRRSKRPRLVWAVADPLRRIQRQVAIWLRPHVQSQAHCVTAFRKGSSPFANAMAHAGRSVVVTADLSDFYGSISLIDVVALFESLGAGRQVAVTLARLSTIDERLVQGGRASPFIANLVADKLDAVIQSRLPLGARYTRYVDDVTVSVDEGPAPSVEEMRDWIRIGGFSMREGSYTLRTKQAGPYVTGLQVGGPAPRAPRLLRRRIERFLHFAEAFDVTTAAARTFKTGRRATNGKAAMRYVQGVVHWLMAIDTTLAVKWSLRLARLR